MSVVAVIPSIVPLFTTECLATLSPELVDVSQIPHPDPFHQREPVLSIINGKQWTDGKPDFRLVTVWNTSEHNLGCAGSWNVGVDEALRIGADWLWIISAGVRFGKAGGTDFLECLQMYGLQDVLGLEAGNDLGWHCIAFPRRVLERVGRFDPRFHPAFFEDNDLSYRIQLAYGIDSRSPDFRGPLWPKVEIQARLPEVAHGIIRSGVTVDFVALEKLYIAKWGNKSPGETFTHPYNDDTLDLTYTGTPPVSLTRAR